MRRQSTEKQVRIDAFTGGMSIIVFVFFPTNYQSMTSQDNQSKR